MVKNSPPNAGDARDMGSIPASGRSLGGGNGNPVQYSCLENPMERSLMGYSPWSRKELDTTEHTHTRTHTHTHTHTHCCFRTQLGIEDEKKVFTRARKLNGELKQRIIF